MITRTATLIYLRRLTLDHLEDLCARLRIERHLAEKTIRNVIDGSLRAMVRDARKAGIGPAFPFAEMEWPRSIVAGPDPFTAEERDRLLDYFLRNGWRHGRGGGHYEIRLTSPTTLLS